MKKRPITLEQFTRKSGSQRFAAIIVGVDASTYSRWVNRVTKPRGLAARRLVELGVSTSSH